MIPCSDNDLTVDAAHVSQRDRWLHHPVLGDPSWDAFRRRPGNPVHRGGAPYAWPVNGFFFDDPVSGAWYLFIGHYQRHYATQVDGPPPICTLRRSRDRGQTWDDLGPIFTLEGIRLDGVHFPVTHWPDVCVVYADGRYHMAFDWGTSNMTWENAFAPQGGPDGADGGAGYAVAERPEGPWTPCPRPLFRNSRLWQQPFFGKYRRLYATSLLRRRDDWLLLALADSAAFHTWGLIGATAADPCGPWSGFQPLLHTEDHRYHPPTVEFFPAFAHEGYAYAPATSVAANRNYQAIFRAPLAQAHAASAWALWQEGSVWHAEDVEHEAAGIWGQTFAGGVRDGVLRVMFPSRDAEGLGTINLAERSWVQPYREQGFVVSAHAGPLVTLLRGGYRDVALTAEVQLRGDASLLWSHRAPLGPDRIGANASPDRKALDGCRRLRMSDRRWELSDLGPDGTAVSVASGPLPVGPELAVGVDHRADGMLTLTFNGALSWAGELPVVPGAVGLWLEPHTHLRVDALRIRGTPCPHQTVYLGADALLGAGQRGWTDPADPVGPDWDEDFDAAYRWGAGCRCKVEGGRAKWNVRGDGFVLWSPKGPDLGDLDVYCDGERLGAVSLRSNSPQPSAPVFEATGLAPGRHAVVLKGVRGPLVVDCLAVLDRSLEPDLAPGHG